MKLIRKVLALLLLTLPALSSAVTAGFSPINMHHSSWTAKDGAPASVIGIAQTPDRWMWIASLNGLYRFDGVRFERFKLGDGTGPRGDIWGIKVLKNGDLWIGYRFGGASVWRNGKLESFGAAEGLSTPSVLDFEQDDRGRVWASTAQGFRLFDGKRWNPVDERQSGRTGACFLATDAGGTIWARCENGVYALPKGADAFGKKIHDLAFGRLALAGDGTLWATGGGPNELLALSGPGKDRALPAWPRPRTGGGPVLFESDGKHIWSSQPAGIIRYGPAEKGVAFGVANGLSGNLSNCFYQDDEGNVWVGTENGLDRFRNTALSGVAFPAAFWDAEAIAAGDNGALWVDRNEVKSPDIETLSALPAQTPATAVSVIYKDGADVWTAGRDGLWHYRDGERTRVPLPDYVTFMQFFTMAKDTEGGLWLAARNVGILRLKDGVWQRGGGYRELEGRATSITRDSSGRMWFGTANNGVRVLDAGKVIQYGPEQGLAVGSVQQVVSSGQDIWIGGTEGLAHFDGSRFQKMTGEDDDTFLGISGLIDFNSKLWLNGAAGITAISKAELALAIRNGKHRLKFQRFNYLDGLHGTATNLFPIPSAVKGSDGKLWFATGAGIFWLDTEKAIANKVPPQVFIRTVNVDNASVPWTAGQTARIAPNPGRLRIDYTALAYTMPERMQFQYRIDGVDRQWQEGGATRSASYTGLGPGRYRLHVRAANNDGVWSTSDAVADFEVVPAYYQTLWFQALCATLLALLLWLSYKLRMAYVARRAVQGYAIKMAERGRIARDLHDTLLQSVHALSLRLTMTLNKLPPESAMHGEIEHSLDLVEAALQEGQDKLHGLRSGPVTELLDEASHLVLGEYPQLPLASSRTGVARELAPFAREQLLAIALEALRNAARHAQATQIHFQVSYDTDALRMTIADNGKGLPDKVASAGCSDSRWGLVGMRERVEQIGAQLTVNSQPDAGTTISIALPAKCAYVQAR